MSVPGYAYNVWEASSQVFFPFRSLTNEDCLVQYGTGLRNPDKISTDVITQRTI
jgi:hypothetical protein